ncbi:hypothetical protein [Nostocoides sp.]
MINSGKAILHIEDNARSARSARIAPGQCSTLLKNRDLDAAILGQC